MTWRRTLFCLSIAVVAMVSGGSAQEPPSQEAYLVAYVDIMPSQRPAMLTALGRYRDASRREDGSSRIDAFEQIGRPAHFVVVETWRDQSALDAHRLTTHAREFHEALESIRVSGYDERPYNALAVAPPGGRASGQSIYVISHVDIGTASARAEAPGLLRRLAEQSRREPGCLGFDVLQHATRGNHFTVIEVWRDQDALDAHAAAAHTRAYRDVLQPITGSPVDERVYTAVE